MQNFAQEFAQQIINGLSYGAIYALIAVGYTLVYGVLRLINFAHGDVYMVGAMVGLYTFTRFGISATASVQQAPRQFMILLFLALIILCLILLARIIYRPWRIWPRRELLISILITGGLLILSPFLRWAPAENPIERPPSWSGFLLVTLAAVAVCALLGYAIERIAYRPLRNQPRITALITAIGVSMFLEFGGQLAFGASPQAFPQLIPGLEKQPTLLQFANGHFLVGDQINTSLGGILIARVDALIFITTIILMAALRWIILHTRTGMALRAVSFRFDTASLMGIDVNRIISFTFVLGSALAAIAGILVALRSPKIDPLMGLIPGLKAFVAAVLGGIGNIPGAVLGGLLLGLTEVMVAGYFPQGSQYREGVAFFILIAVLLVKPSGLLGQNVVEKV